MTPERFQKLKTTLTQRQPDLTVLTADVHKTHNIFAVLRTCDATGIFQMHAVSPGGKIRHHHMVSGGSRRWVDIKIHGNLKNAVHALRNDGWLLAAAHPCERARDYHEIDYTRKIATLWSYPEIAQRCKVRGRPYPELTDDGVMKSNPLA
jgi:tRNA (guanosine-2'-O-)-methyltransferase